jgi:hypothetical protein
LCEIWGAHDDAFEDASLLDRKIARNHYIVYFDIQTKFLSSSGEMQRCRVLKVTLHLAFRCSVTLDIVRRQPKSGKVTQRLQFDVSKGGQVPYVKHEMTSRLDVVTVGLPVVWPSPPLPVVAARRPSGGRWTVVQLVSRVRSYDNYKFSA